MWHFVTVFGSLYATRINRVVFFENVVFRDHIARHVPENESEHSSR